MWRALLVYGIVLGVLYPAACPLQAQGGGDRIYLAAPGSLAGAALPRGPMEDAADSPFAPEALAFTDTGELWVIARVEADEEFEFRIYRLEDRTVVEEHVLPLTADNRVILDLSRAPGGALYLLTTQADPASFPRSLGRIDLGSPVTYTELARFPSDVEAIAPNGDQLWVVAEDQLRRMNPEVSFAARGTDIVLDPAFRTLAADTDSTGTLWLLQEVPLFDPPPRQLLRLDPNSRTTRVARLPIDGATSALAIRPGCAPDATTQCLMGGRFSARVTWRDYDDRTGDGQVVERGSADSGLFWFFTEDNVELMIKLVDGCDENDRFWVFAAGTTDIEYELEVTDLLTGERFQAENPLGRASSAVTATNAFATCGGLL